MSVVQRSTNQYVVLTQEYRNRHIVSDSAEALSRYPDNSIDLIITSPPYIWARDYDIEGQYGLEYWFDCVPLILNGTMPGYCGSCYMCHMHKVFKECYRVLKPTGILYLNIGDTMYGSGFGKDENIEKTLQATDRGTIKSRDKLREHRKDVMKKKWYRKQCFCKIPERFSMMIVDRIGFIERGKLIWRKKNGFPAPWKNRPTPNYEFVYQFVKKSPGYYYNRELTREPLAKTTKERMKYDERPFNQMKLGVNNRHNTGAFKFGNFGGVKHAGKNGNATYSGKEYKPHDGKKNPGSIWDIATRSYPKEYCMKCDVLRGKKQLYYLCSECKQYIYERSKNDRSCSSHTPGGQVGIINRKPDRPAPEECGICKKVTARMVMCQVCENEVHCHFAMFPEELVERCIKAGCPSKVCAECGIPYFPVIKPSEAYAKKLGKGFHNHSDDSRAGMMQDKQIKAVNSEYIIEGYKKQCKCDTEKTIAPVIMDIFSGWDTVGAVGKRLSYEMPDVYPDGIDNIAIDLDPRNVRAGELRVEEEQLKGKMQRLKSKMKKQKKREFEDLHVYGCSP